MTTQPAEIAETLASAWAEHQAGRLPTAEQGYRRALGLDPDNPDALHLLGLAAHQAGRHREAIGLIAQALQQRPDEAAYFCNLGEAHRALGELAQALACQRQALVLDPGLAEAHNNLGLVLQAQGQHGEANASYRQALALKPGLADAEINLGNLLANEGRPAEAVAHFERALEHAPDSAKGHFNLANALRDQGLVEAAIAHYSRALELEPGSAEAHNNLGQVRLQRDEVAGAIESFEAALAGDANHAEALNNLGLARLARGERATARAAFERALAARPRLAQAHNNLGLVHQLDGEREAAIVSFRRALEVDPDYVEAHSNLGHVLKEQGRFEDSIAAFLRAVEGDGDHADSTAQLVYQLQQGCQWDRLAELCPKVDAQTRAALADGKRPGETPFGSLTRSSDPAWHAALAKAWAQGIERRAAETGLRFSGAERRLAKDRLTIGYLSGDFDDHPVTHQITKLLALHDRTRFEIRGYGYGRQQASRERERVVMSCDAFVDLEPLSDVDAAKRINADGVDILVDLTGYTKGNRMAITALRPAPIQVSYLGFLGTSGGSSMDYLIADPICVPPAEARWFTEQLVHLPDCCLVFGEDPRPDNRFKRLDFGLPDDGFVFCSLNANAKLEPVMFEVWMELLRQVPDSVLWLYRGSATAVANLQREARGRGVESRRLIFADRVPYADNLKRLQLADLALDTRIYNGGLTTANALWAGVPVLTLKGTDFVSRMAASMLMALGLPELVTPSLEAYAARALVLARSPDLLAALRADLDHNLKTAPLFDTARFARHLEAAYGEMWQGFLAKAPPRPMTIAAST